MCGEHHSMFRQGEPLVIGPTFLRMNSSEGTASVTYELHVLDADENRLAVWEVFGTASNQGGIVTTEAQIRQALRAAAASFIRPRTGKNT